MALTPEAVVRSSEQTVVSKGVEVAPRSIPVFDGANVVEIQDAFTGNLNLVSGGTVAAVDGEVIQTDGILGSAKIKIDTKLEQIAFTGEALAQDRGQFGKGRFRGPRAVRELEQENRRTSQADNKVLSENRKRVKEQQDRIKKICKEKHITLDLQTTYDSMIGVEEHLANNGSADLEPIRQNLEALKWTRRAPTRERVEDLLDGARTLAPGYEEYKALKIGQGEGESRVKGLRDFEAAAQTVEQRRNANAADVRSRLEAANAKAKDWERKNAEFREQDTPEQRRLKTSHALITRVEEYLGSHYVPDVDRLTQVGADLIQTRGHLADAKDYLTRIAGIVSTRAAKFISGKASQEVLGDLEKKIADLEDEQNKLVDPVKRLTQDGAPRELKAMVKKVQARGFDVAKIAPRERVLAEAVTALLGKGIVKVEKQSEEETPLPGGEIPEVAGPAEDDALVGASEVLESLPLESANKFADLAMAGSLTVQQILDLPLNPEAEHINNDLADPENFDHLEADLKYSLAASEAGRGGISRDDLSELVVNALQRIAAWSSGGDTNQLFNFAWFKKSLEHLSIRTDFPEGLKNRIDETGRLIAIAETADRLRFS